MSIFKYLMPPQIEQYFMKKFYQFTNIISWDGNDNNGLRLPQTGNYFMSIKIGDIEYGSQKIVVQ